MAPPACFEAPPSEAYLCAIWRNLREAVAASGDDAAAADDAAALSVPLLRSASAEERAAGAPAVLPLARGSGAACWRRPAGGAAALLTLRAVCYEAGLAAQPPWELPRAAATLAAALEAAGVASVPALLQLLRRGAALRVVVSHAPLSPLRAALAAAGQPHALDAAAEAALAAVLLPCGQDTEEANGAAAEMEAAPASG
jgi:hypothetical protein